MEYIQPLSSQRGKKLTEQRLSCCGSSQENDLWWIPKLITAFPTEIIKATDGPTFPSVPTPQEAIYCFPMFFFHKQRNYFLCSGLLEGWFLFVGISDSEVNVALKISLEIRLLI